jgi:putative spermidine/putrescine transport system ATP-binding protein
MMSEFRSRTVENAEADGLAQAETNWPRMDSPSPAGSALRAANLGTDGRAYVRFENIQKSYDGEILVVRDLNLEIKRGEFLTLLGPSGSGKTTTLMMLAGFETPTHGEIIVDGVPLTKVPPYKRNIGVVFQNFALFPHMTVVENVAYPLRVRKIPKPEVEARVERALAMIRLPDCGSRRPAQLSGGQQQRVAVARALVFDPKLLLMDEPLGALDKNLREQMQYEIKHLHEQLGLTVVYVTHDQHEALIMSDRIAVFSEGRIQQVAAPAMLYEQPENAFVAQFIGENNRLIGRVIEVRTPLCKVVVAQRFVVEALAVNIAGMAKDTVLSLRPERVVLDPPSGSCANIFEAEVKEVIYVGNHVRARLKVCGSDEFIVMLPNSGGGRQLAREERILVGWRAEDCRALDAS